MNTIALSTTKNLKALLSILIVAFGYSADAQNGFIEGRIIYKADSSALYDSWVLIGNTKSGVGADKSGFFRMELPPGSYTLIVNSPFYGKDTVTDVRVISNQITTLSLGLPADPCYTNNAFKNCPVDGKKRQVIPIVYGLPRRKTMVLHKLGLRKLGGCEINGCEPNWYCKQHEIEF